MPAQLLALCIVLLVGGDPALTRRLVNPSAARMLWAGTLCHGAVPPTALMLRGGAGNAGIECDGTTGSVTANATDISGDGGVLLQRRVPGDCLFPHIPSPPCGLMRRHDVLSGAERTPGVSIIEPNAASSPRVPLRALASPLLFHDLLRDMLRMTHLTNLSGDNLFSHPPRQCRETLSMLCGLHSVC